MVELINPKEMEFSGSLGYEQVSPQHVKFTIFERRIKRASVIIDFGQCIELLKGLAPIVGVGTHYEQKRIIKP